MASRNQATVEQGYRILQRLQERGLQAPAQLHAHTLTATAWMGHVRVCMRGLPFLFFYFFFGRLLILALSADAGGAGGTGGGGQPTAVTFSALMAVVAGSARQGKATIRDGEMVLENMARRGVGADVVTYNALLAVCVGVAQVFSYASILGLFCLLLGLFWHFCAPQVC